MNGDTTILLYLVGGFIGFLIAAILLFPLVDRIDYWWSGVSFKPRSGESREDRMKSTADAMRDNLKK